MISNSIIKCAIKEAKKSNFNFYHIGAVIFRGNKILSSGRNSERSHKLSKKYIKNNLALHAEQHAICNLNDWENYKKCDILIIRLNNQEQMRLARPCLTCMNLIKHLKFKNIYYSDSNGQIIKEKITY